MDLRVALALGLARQGRLRSYGETRRYGELRENDDGTFDLVGVEILAAGGPIHGQGSPPEGDFWSLEELRAMAEADAELGDEIMPPNKIGHPDAQTLVRNSIAAGELDLPMPEPGEMPAVGWLEDLRLEGTKLLADIKSVPKLLAEAIQKGAYRTRSVELAKVTSQTSGKTYDWVVTGLAWLGAKLPAVKTLGDVIALYEGDLPLRDRRVVEYAVGDVIWNPRLSLQALRADVQEALNGPASGGMVEPRWYVRDVSIDSRAIVEDWASVAAAELDAYVVSFTIGDDGTVTVAPANEWTPAESTWVEKARGYAEANALTLHARAADTGAKMRYTAIQRRTFAEATGLAEADVTDEMLAASGVPEATEDPAPEPDPASEPDPTPDPAPEPEARANAALEARVVSLETELLQSERRSFCDTAIAEGRIAPGQRPALERFFNADAEGARAWVASLEPNERLLEELGSDDEDEETRELSERTYAESASGRLGIAEKDLV